MIREAPLEREEGGLVPKGDGWFVVNTRDARWKDGHFGAYTRFEGDVNFPRLGINVSVLQPGQPSCMYHGEDEQEDFVVLSGECLLLVEGQERRLGEWDFFHCPPWTEHVLIGAGGGPCLIVAVGSRTHAHDGVVYPAAEFAQRHGAAVDVETRDAKQAYANFADDVATPFREEWLPRR